MRRGEMKTIEEMETENAALKQFIEDLGKYAVGQELLYKSSLESQLRLTKENAALKQQVEKMKNITQGEKPRIWTDKERQEDYYQRSRYK
jgi:hypothetical protein